WTIILSCIITSIIKFCLRLFLNKKRCLSKIFFVRVGVAINLPEVILFLLLDFTDGSRQLLLSNVKHRQPPQQLLAIGMSDVQKLTKPLPPLRCIRRAD